MNNINTFLKVEPTWVLESQWNSPVIPAATQDWLREKGSLTLRMKDSFAGDFSVTVEAEGWSPTFSQDALALELGQDSGAFVREVVLKIAEIPYVFARTTIPKDSLKSLQQLTKLGNKPLGEVIFSYPELKRTRLDISSISVHQLLPSMASLLDKQASIWARRNTYDIHGNSFIVSEFFLPIMFQKSRC